MTSEWLDDLLDQDPGEPVPDGFAQRLRARIRDEQAAPSEQTTPRESQAPILRPRFRTWVSSAAAAALMLAVGYWLGRGGPAIETGSIEPDGPQVASIEELVELYDNREFYGSIEMLTDSSLELGLSDYSTAGYAVDSEE